MAMEWELSKENVQPLKEGRNVDKLNASLKARLDGSMKAKIPEEHRKMVEAIDAYSGNDPLQPWIDCIKWVKEAYPSGGSQSRLLPLLELCARTFCKDKRYVDDLRYLKVWMDYAERCTNPREIYSFLQDNNIGQQHALFYEHAARFWENQQNISQAQTLFELGIARKAQPLDSLKAVHRRFLHRAMADSSSKDETRAPPAGQLPGRAFGVQIAGASRSNISQPTRKPNNFKPDKNTPLQFSVFVDVDEKSETVSRQDTARNWTGESEKNKENVQHATTWKGVKLPQKKSAMVAPQITLEVFRDEMTFKNPVDVEQKPGKKRVPASRSLRHDDINSLNSSSCHLEWGHLLHLYQRNILVVKAFILELRSCGFECGWHHVAF